MTKDRSARRRMELIHAEGGELISVIARDHPKRLCSALLSVLVSMAGAAAAHGQCAISCPAGAAAEPESCGLRLNDGCNLIIPTYTQIFCGMTVCGTSWAQGGDRDSDWYTFNVTDPDGNGAAQINATLTAEFPALFFVLNSDCGNILAFAQGESDQCSSTTISACVSAPGTYRIFVSTGTAAGAIFDGVFCGNANQYTLTVTCDDACSPPVNDRCVDALPISDGATFFSTELATTDGPAHAACLDPASGDTQVHNDIWYSYTATCTGDLVVDVCNSANFDTRIAVYDGCACPVGDANLLVCNDDMFQCGGGTSALFAPVVAGQCYLIRIGGFGGAVGLGTVRLNCFPGGLCPDTGDCDLANGSPGCADASCCETVCDYDQYCCLVDWDEQCVQEASQLCLGEATEACCLSEGVCIQATASDCLGFGGSPQGAGTACGGQLTCLLEACCFPNESCQDLTRDECLTAGGTPNGPSTDCATFSCAPPREACCLTETVCINVDPAECLAFGGVSAGPGTDCATHSCQITCPSDIAPLDVPDGTVSVLDLLMLLQNWGPCAIPCDADIVDDGVINVTDLLSLLSAWGPCP